MLSDELPEGWATAPIGDLVDLNPKADLLDETKVGFVPMSLIGSEFIEPIRFESRLWKDVKKGYTHFSDGDVLLAKITPCFENGKGALVSGLPNRVGAGSTEYFVCRPKKDVLEPKYLHAFFKTPTFMTKAETQMSGSVGHKRVPKEHIVATNLPLAPLAEQKRIADKLEAVLGRVDACRTRLDRVPDLLKRFRQSVLAAATSGRLTEDWREENGTDYEWEKVQLGDLMESKPRNGYSPRAVEFETAIRSLTLTATTSGKFRGEHSKFIDEQILESSHLWLEPGDILIQRANTIEYVGVSAIFDGPKKKFIYPDLMMKCRANKRTTTGFLHLLLHSEAVRHYFRENATGTAGNMPKINQGTVISAPTILPPLSEQDEIVRRVEALFAFADQIETRLTQTRAQVERLTPATLAKAFRGELVPQDPLDEPASVLLERLRQSTPNDAKPQRAGWRKREMQAVLETPAAPTVVTAAPATLPQASSSPLVAARKSVPEVPEPPAPARVNVEDLDKEDLMSLLREVLLEHGPCDRDTAIQKAAHALGYKRTGSVVTPLLDNAIRTAVRRRVLFNEAGELRVNRASITDMEAEDRPFMKEQFLAAISQGGRAWIEREDAPRLFANWFGFRRTGHQIQDRVKSLINGLIRDQALETDGSCIRRV